MAAGSPASGVGCGWPLGAAAFNRGSAAHLPPHCSSPMFCQEPCPVLPHALRPVLEGGTCSCGGYAALRARYYSLPHLEPL